MEPTFSKEVALRALMQSKGYSFDPKNQFWSREWTTNKGQETVLEVAIKTEDGEWNKLMMNKSGHVFYAETIGAEIN